MFSKDEIKDFPSFVQRDLVCYFGSEEYATKINVKLFSGEEADELTDSNDHWKQNETVLKGAVDQNGEPLWEKIQEVKKLNASFRVAFFNQIVFANLGMDEEGKSYKEDTSPETDSGEN